MDHWQVALYVPVVAILVATETFSSLFFTSLSPYWPAISYILHGILSTLSPCFYNPNSRFLTIFIYRYYRFIGHLFAKLFLYTPAPIVAQPTVTSRNVHVIIPTIDPSNGAFDACVRSILIHNPRWLTIVTGGQEFEGPANEVARSLHDIGPNTEIIVRSVPVQNKRVQINEVLNRLAGSPQENQNTIVVCVDDHAWWQGEHFLEHLLAPFEDSSIALVGTRKEVVRMRGTSLLDSFINLIGCLYLERHNFEITGQNALDGGVLVISARTCAIRGSVILNEDFISNYANERFFFNKFGPLNSDDDNFVTRYVLRQGWKIKFQNDAQNATCTDIGITGGLGKIDGQLTRWARSQWRSNPASLFTEGVSWQHGLWWTSHAAYGAWFINAPLWSDWLMWQAWANCTWEWFDWKVLLAIMFLTKLIKLFGHFRRHPSDIWWLPFYQLFTYIHVWYKILALFTFWDTTWSGRKLESDPVGGSDNDSSGLPTAPGRWIDSVTPPSPRPSMSNQLESRASSIGTENSFTRLYGKPPNFTGPPNLFTPWGSAQTSMPHSREPQYNRSRDSVGSLPTRGPEEKAPTPRNPSEPNNVYRPPYYSSTEVGMEYGHLYTPPASPPHSTASPRTSNPPVKSQANSNGKAMLSGPKIRSAQDFVDQLPLRDLPSPAFGEDHRGLSSPIRPSINPQFPGTQDTRPAASSIQPNRTNYSTSMPPVPSIMPVTKINIVDAVRTEPKTVRSNTYHRQFVRGCNCRRLHGSGAWLGLPSGEHQCRMCGSPHPNRYILDEKPQPRARTKR